MLTCSIIICTHNRAKILLDTLRSVYKIDWVPGQVELIVVDSASTDGTEHIVKPFFKYAPFRSRYVREDKPGLSRARNRGLREASHAVVLFLDDDARPCEPRWVSNILNVFTDDHVGAAGGDVIPLWPSGEPPTWLHQHLLYFFGITRFQSKTQKRCRYPTYRWGANLAFRKDSLIQVGGFSEDLGRVGSGLQSGEETEACLKLERAGLFIMYVPKAGVEHVIDIDRLSVNWMRERACAAGASTALLERRNFSQLIMVQNLLWRTMILGVALCGKLIAGMVRSSRYRLFMELEFVIARSYLANYLKSVVP